MDFGSCCIDCCKSCNPTSQKHKPAAGQGDSKSSNDITSNQNLCFDTEKGKNLRSSCVQDKKKFGVKTERSKKSFNVHCNCTTKNGKKTDTKVKQGVRQEKDGSNMIKKCNIWNHIFTNDFKCKAYKCCGSKESQDSKDLSCVKLSKDNISELEEKIEFLSRLFECHVRKILNEDFIEKFQMKVAGSVFRDFWQLFSLNKRMCAAEEGIEKLSAMLEELYTLIESIKKKDSCWNDDETIFSNSVDFEEMTIVQKIDFLKKRNDLLTNFMQSLLGANSLEEICSKLDLVPKEKESSQTIVKPRSHFGGMDQSSVVNKEMGTKTGIQVNDSHHRMQRNSLLNEGRNLNRAERREEQGLKYSGNKLSVISEQSECVTDRNNGEEKRQDEHQTKSIVRNLKGKFSQVSDTNEVIESNVGLADATSVLLAQEAFLKSSLDKVQYELLSKLESTEKNFLRENLNVISQIQFSEKEDNFCDIDSHFDSLSEMSCTLGESDNDAKSFNDYLSHNSNTYEMKKENREVMKLFNNLIPAATKSRKRNEENTGSAKTKYSQHIIPRGSTSLTSSQKLSRIGRYVPESCSALQDRRKMNSINIQRPVTMPSEGRKLSSPLSSSKMAPRSYLKPLIQTESPKRTQAINNSLKNKNKILLSKKSFVRTS